MALVKCRECGGQVSKKAEKCPHCGAPVKKQTSGCAWLFAIVGVLMIVSYITISSDSSYSGSSSGSTTSAPKISKPTPPSSVTETFIDEEARSLVIRHIEPNNLKVGGREFQTMPNPKGAGVFVFDPRTRFDGIKRNLIWLVVNQQAYPLNGPSKTITPTLKWPREADQKIWNTTGLSPYMATDAIEIVFGSD